MQDEKKNVKLKNLDNSFLCLKYTTFLKHFLLLFNLSYANLIKLIRNTTEHVTPKFLHIES